MKRKILAGLAAGFLLGGIGTAKATEMVVNGNFSDGNTGFTTSYRYSDPMHFQPEHYTVGTIKSFGDHTTGSGKMMIVDGAYAATPLWTVWQEVFTVTTNTDYEFEAWARAITEYSSAPTITLSFLVNGTEVGILSLVNPNQDYWQSFSFYWNSGSATSVTLSIVNLQTNNSVPGNDFAMDDISFATRTSITPVPEPGTFVLFGMGLVSLAGGSIWKRKLK